MEIYNLVTGEQERVVARFSDVDNNARKLENVGVSSDDEAVSTASIVEVREWTSADGSVGTEVEVLAPYVGPGEATITIFGDPLPGEPSGMLSLSFGIHNMTAAAAGSIVSAVTEIIPVV